MGRGGAGGGGSSKLWRIFRRLPDPPFPPPCLPNLYSQCINMQRKQFCKKYSFPKSSQHTSLLVYINVLWNYTGFLNNSLKILENVATIWSKTPQKNCGIAIRSSYRTVYYSQLSRVVKLRKGFEILGRIRLHVKRWQMRAAYFCILYCDSYNPLLSRYAQKNYFKKEYMCTISSVLEFVRNVRCSFLFQLLQFTKQAIYVEVIDLVNAVSLDILYKSPESIELFIEDRAFLLLYDLAPPPSVSKLSLFLISCVLPAKSRV